MENLRAHDSVSNHSSTEARVESDVWARIESIDPEALAAKLAELLTDEKIQRVKQSKFNQYTSDIRTTSTIEDLEKIEQDIAEKQQREDAILKQIALGNGTYAILKLQIDSAKARGDDVAVLEQQMNDLLTELAPLEGEYKSNNTLLNMSRDSKAMLERLAVVQGPYVAAEKVNWEISTEYEQAFGALADAIARVKRLPLKIPAPMAPPDISMLNSTDPLPLSLDCQPEEPRQLLTIDIQKQLRETKIVAEQKNIEKESPPAPRSYLELVGQLKKPVILVSKSQYNSFKELINQDQKI